jgi:hypothetical protein
LLLFWRRNTDLQQTFKLKIFNRSRSSRAISLDAEEEEEEDDEFYRNSLKIIAMEL